MVNLSYLKRCIPRIGLALILLLTILSPIVNVSQSYAQVEQEIGSKGDVVLEGGIKDGETPVTYALPELKTDRDYYQSLFPSGLVYSSAWSGTFSYVPNGMEQVLFDDNYDTDWGICVFSLPKDSLPPSGEQGGTSLKSLTIEEAQVILESYDPKALVKPYSEEIIEVMPSTHKYVGAWAGDKLAQKFSTESARTIETTVIDEITQEEKTVTLEKTLTSKQQEYLTETAGIELKPVDLVKFDPDRYFVMGQVFFVDGTATTTEDGRQVTDITVNVTAAASQSFTVYMANGTTATMTNGVGCTIDAGSPQALAAGLNTFTVSGNGTLLFDITIGTAANWNTVNSWSAASGGQCGASVPTNADNTLFNANSFTAGSQILTVNAAASCLSMDWTGATNNPQLKTGGANFNIYGNVTLALGMTVTTQAPHNYTYFLGNVTHDFTSDGVAWGALLYLSVVGGTVNFIDNFSSGGYDFRYESGGLITNGNAVSCAIFTIGAAGNKTLTLGASTVTCVKWDYSGSNLTLTANTSTINVSGTGAFAGGAPAGSYHDINLNGTAHTISGTWTGEVVTRNGTATNANTLTLTSGTTITCTTFAMIGNSRANQLLVQSSTLGTAATITTTNWTGTNNVDLMDITATNAVDFSVAGLNILTIGDAGGNTGITFPATLGTATYSAGGTNKASEVGRWDIGRIPLVGIDDVSVSGVGTILTYDMPRMGKTITIGGTSATTLSQSISVYGSLTLAGASFNPVTYTVTLRGRSAGLTLTPNTMSFYNLTLSAPTGTYTLGSNCAITNIFAMTAGTIVDGGFTTTLSAATAITKWNATGGTYTATGTIVLTSTGILAQTFTGAGLTYNNVRQEGAGNYALTITGNNTFNGYFQVDASAAPKTLIATGTTQIVDDFKRGSAIGTNVVTITGGTWSKTGGRLVNGTGTFTGSPKSLVAAANTVACTGAGTATITLPAGMTGTAFGDGAGGTATLTPTTTINLIAGANTIDTGATTGNVVVTLIPTDTVPIALNYMTISNSTAVPALVWYAGNLPVGRDAGGNTGWVFTQVSLAGLVTTNAATGIVMDKDAVTGGLFNGTIGTIDGTPTIITRMEYGLTAPAYGSFTTDATVYASGVVAFIIPNNLTPGATYHYRFVCENSNGITNGADQSFTFTLPTITVQVANPVSMTAAGVTSGSFNGNITNMGVASSVYAYAEYGLTAPAYGTSTANVTRSAVGAFTIPIPGALTPGATYHYRINTLNGAITVNGNDQLAVFTMPTVTTSGVTGLAPGVFTMNGNITNMGVASSCYVSYDYGITAYDRETVNITKLAIGPFSEAITSWVDQQPVYYRAVAKVGSVEVYGAQVSFNSLASISIFTGFRPMILLSPFLVLLGFLIPAVIVGLMGIKRRNYLLSGLAVVLLLVGFIGLQICFSAISNIVF
jgi:hypothetical protein